MSEGKDSTQVFLGLMGLLTVVAGVWAGYTFREVKRYEEARQQAITQFPELQKLSARIKFYEERGGPEPEQMRTRIQNLASAVGLRTDGLVREGASTGPDYKEKTYQVKLKGISRSQIVRYIHRVRSDLPNVRTKWINMEQTARSAPPDDQWNWVLVFAHREKLKEKE